MEALIQQGWLQRFVAGRSPVRHEDTSWDPPTWEERRLAGPIGEIRVIVSGLARGGESSSVRMSHVRQIRMERDLQIMVTEKPTKQHKVENPPITFSANDAQGVSQAC